MAATGSLVTNFHVAPRPNDQVVRVHVTRDLTSSRSHELLSLAKHAVRTSAHEIGWLTNAVYDQRHKNGHILSVTNNGDCVGFCMWLPNLVYAETRILQIWVRPDARLILHGRALVDALDEKSRNHACWWLRLWCGEDLAANTFWRALGFSHKATRAGRKLKGRRHLLWMRPVPPRTQREIQGTA